MVQKSFEWLSQDALRLWLDKGFDLDTGAFEETLSLNGTPLATPRRLMVQARQIYSFRMGAKLNACDKEKALDAIRRSAKYILNYYSLPSGAFIHSVSKEGKPHNQTPDLYGQAFALFGLAHAYAVDKDDVYKNRALSLISYLKKHRRGTLGGYTELVDDKVVYQSNPHMHLFEAFLSWMEIDPDTIWTDNATEILELCLNKFIDSKSGFLAEHFDENWNIQSKNNKFIFEPGHQYEWAWLMGKFEKMTGRQLKNERLTLFDISEQYGIHPTRRLVYDEVWSDLEPKLLSSRFWPQTERIKIALQLAEESDHSERKRFLSAADEGLKGLFNFFNVSTKGLWLDKCLDNGEFLSQPAKASSLYHIIAALHDYIEKRPILGDLE